MKIVCLPLFAAAASIACGAPAVERIVANPVAERWEAPSFRGKAFWPVFPVLSHSYHPGQKPAWNWATDGGLGVLPLLEDYACRLSTHSYRAGAAKYQFTDGKKTGPTGKRFYLELMPPEKHLGGTYTLRQLFGDEFGSYLYEADWHESVPFDPKYGNPFTLQIAESRPATFLDGEDRGDKEDFRRWVEKHPGFLGFSAMDEIDSDAYHYKTAMTWSSRWEKITGETAEDLKSRFPVYRDRFGYYEFIKAAWDVERKFHFGCDRFWPLYCSCLTLSHINASLGAAGLDAEVSASMGSSWGWAGAYTRGASRQWGIPFKWYCATFYRGYRRGSTIESEPVAGDNKWPRDGVHHPKRPPYMGASLSLTARQKYYGWLIGASFMEDEPWTMLCTTATNGVPCPSPYAEVFNDVYVKSVKIPRGAPLTPIALLTPLTETVDRNCWAAGMPRKDGFLTDVFGIPAYILALQPVHEPADTVGDYFRTRRVRGDEGCLYNNRFGEIWDVLTVDAGQQREKLVAALKHYPAAFLVGSYRKGELDIAALEAYVRAGGTLVVSCDYVEEGFVSPELAGVDFDKEKKDTNLRCSTCNPRPQTLQLHDAYTLHRGEPGKGTRVLYTDEHGAPVVWAHDHGNGRVITLACRRGLPDEVSNAVCRFDDDTFRKIARRLIKGEIALPIVERLIERIVAETVPVAIEGDVQWGVNQVKVKGEGEGVLVWLFNNKGIAKFSGEPADVDLAKTATVRLSMRGVRDPSAFVFRDAVTGRTVDPAAVEVGPGAVRLITVGR